jgi:hypothetical protein
MVKRERFTDTKSSAVQQKQEYPIGLRVDVIARMVIGDDGIEQATQLFARIDIWLEGLERSGDVARQRRTVDVAACNGKPIESAKDAILAFPETSDRSVSRKKGCHFVDADVLHGHVAYGMAKRLEGAGFRPKAHTHRLLMGNIVGSRVGELHVSPLRSKSATSRSPAKSTLA